MLFLQINIEYFVCYYFLKTFNPIMVNYPNEFVYEFYSMDFHQIIKNF